MHVGVYLLNCLPAYLPINLPTLPSIWRAWLVIEQQMLGTKCAKTIVFTMVSDPNLVAYTSPEPYATKIGKCMQKPIILKDTCRFTYRQK